GASRTTGPAAPQTITVGGSAATITVTALDGFGNPIGGKTVTLTATGSNNTLTPPGTTDANGVAAGTLTSTTAETKTVSATVAGTAIAQTATVTVQPAAPAQLAILTEPSGTAQSGVAFGRQPVVQLRDGAGNAVSEAGVTVTATIGSGSGSLGGTTTATTNGSGVASFTSLAISGTGGTYTLSFGATGLTSVGSNTIALSAGAATQLTLTTQPSATAQSGVAFAQQPVVQLRDAAGNTVSQAGITVTAAIATGGGTLGGTLTAATTSSGTASFTNLSISGAAGDRTLSFSATGLTPAVSGTITVGAGAATQVTLTTEPSATAQSGVAFAQQPVVQLRDGAGNPVSESGITVTAAIATGGGTLGGTLTAATNGSGLASFTNLSITGAAGDRTLGFSATGLTGAVSTTITVGAGAATQLTLTTQPSATAQSGVTFAQQ